MQYVGDGIYVTSKIVRKLNLVFVLKKVLKAQSFLRSCSTCSYQWPLRSSNRFEFLQENSHLQSNNLSSSPFCFLFQIPEALSFRKISGDVFYSSAPKSSTILTRNVRPAPALLIKHIHLVALKFSFLSSLPRLELELLCWYELLGIRTGPAFLASKAPDLTTKCELCLSSAPSLLRNPNSDSAVKEKRKNVV